MPQPTKRKFPQHSNDFASRKNRGSSTSSPSLFHSDTSVEQLASHTRTSNFASNDTKIGVSPPGVQRNAKSHNFIYAVSPNQQQQNRETETVSAHSGAPMSENVPSSQDIHFSINDAPKKISRSHLFRNAHFPVYASLSDSPVAALESPSDVINPQALNPTVISATFQQSLQQSLLHSNRVIRSTQPIQESIESLHTLQSSLLSHIRSSSSSYNLQLHTLRDFIQKIFLKMKQLKDFVRQEQEQLLTGQKKDTIQESLVRRELNVLDSWLKEKFDIINQEKIQLEDRLGLYKELIVDKDDTLIRTLKREEMQARKLRVRIEQMEEVMKCKDEHYATMLKQALSGVVSQKQLYDLWTQDIQHIEEEALQRTSSKWRRMYISMSSRFEQVMQESMSIMKKDSNARESKLKEFFQSMKNRYASPDTDLMYSMVHELKDWIGKQQEEVMFAHESDITQWLMEYDEAKPSIMEVRERFEGDCMAHKSGDTQKFTQQMNRIMEIYELIETQIPKNINNVLLQHLHKNLGMHLRKKKLRRRLKTSKTMARIFPSPPQQLAQTVTGGTSRERDPHPGTPIRDYRKFAVPVRPFSQPSGKVFSDTDKSEDDSDSQRLSETIPRQLQRHFSRGKCVSVEIQTDEVEITASFRQECDLLPQNVTLSLPLTSSSNSLHAEDTLKSPISSPALSARSSGSMQSRRARFMSKESADPMQNFLTPTVDTFPNISDIITSRTRNNSLDSVQTTETQHSVESADGLSSQSEHNEMTQQQIRRKLAISMDRIEALQLMHQKADARASQLQIQMEENQKSLQHSNDKCQKLRDSLWEIQELLESKTEEHNKAFETITEERNALAQKLEQMEQELKKVRKKSASEAELYTLRQKESTVELHNQVAKLEQQVQVHQKEAEEAREQHKTMVMIRHRSQIKIASGSRSNSKRSLISGPTTEASNEESTEKPPSPGVPKQIVQKLSVDIGVEPVALRTRSSQTHTDILNEFKNVIYAEESIQANSDDYSFNDVPPAERIDFEHTQGDKYDVSLQTNFVDEDAADLRAELDSTRAQLYSLQRQLQQLTVGQHMKELTKKQSLKNSERNQLLKKYEKSVNIGWSSSSRPTTQKKGIFSGVVAGNAGKAGLMDMDRSASHLATILPALDGLPPTAGQPLSSPNDVPLSGRATPYTDVLKRVGKRKTRARLSSKKHVRMMNFEKSGDGISRGGERSFGDLSTLGSPSPSAVSSQSNYIFHSKTPPNHNMHNIQSLDVPTGRKKERTPILMGNVSVL
mmetsp:Transcript_11172/g.41768  ORF Transcript_11172/g.41768 Transcript_11172/m.41768 type:complete len:1268 (-) Transcript_11172:1754-5557(-)